MFKVFLFAIFLTSFTLLGFLGGRLSAPKLDTTTQTEQKIASQSAIVITKSLEAPSNLLFKTQSATFQGKITNIAGKKLFVNSDEGQTGEFAISDKVVIYKFAPGSSTAGPSNDMRTIETGKEVLIALDLINNQYQAISISYFKTQ